MLRRTFTIASVLSLVLLIGTLVLWVWCGTSCRWVSLPFRGGKVEVASARGRLAFARVFRSRADFAEWGFASEGRSEQPILTADILVNDNEEFGGIGTSILTDPNGTAGQLSQSSWHFVRVVRIRETKFTAGVATGVYYANYFALPYWSMVLLFAVFPLSSFSVRSIHSRLVRRRRRSLVQRRIRGGLCVRCGYNLTGNTSGVCPECGAAVVPSAPASPPSA